MLLIAKKLIGPLFFPATVSMWLLAGGIGFLWFTDCRKLGRALVTLGVAVYAIFTYTPAAHWLLRPLERRYSPVFSVVDTPGAAEARWIVVLGGGHTSDSSLPVNSQLATGTLSRVVEAIRLYRQAPGRRLLFSGGRVFDPVSNASLMAKTAIALGVPAADIVTDERALDTKDEARLLGEHLGADPFLLVTSASHMPRAAALFRGQGLHPVPAPTCFRAKAGGGFHPSRLFPDPSGLVGGRRAVHEYLGYLWAWMRGQTRPPA